jgi:hypothetical protein
MEVPTVQEKSEQIFFVHTKAHYQFMFMDLNKTVLTDLLKLITFFEQCQATNKAAGILERIAKDKKQPKEKKTAHLPAMRSHKSSYQQHCCHMYHNYHQSNRRDRGDHQPDYRHQYNQHHNCPRHVDKDPKSNKSYKNKDDCKRNHFKKKSNKAMHNDQSSSLSAGNSAGKRSHSCSRSPLSSLSWSRSCSSSRSNNNHNVAQDDRKPSTLPKRGYLYSSESDDGGRIHCPDKSGTVFATFSTPTAKKSKHTQK